MSNLRYLAIPRLVAYIAVFVIVMSISKNSPSKNIEFLLLFLIILINSSFRIIKLRGEKALFVVSLLLEIVIIIIIGKMFNPFVIAFLYIILVESYLFLQLKKAFFINLIIYLGVIFCYLPFNGPVNFSIVGFNFFINAILMSFFAAAAYVIKKEQKMKGEIQELYSELKLSKDELEKAHEKLQQYTENIEHIAVLNERNRLAGEIHDSIGHTLTALIIELEICNKLIDKDIKKTRNELTKASELARNALSEVRKSVREIIPSDTDRLNIIDSIKELIAEFQDNTGVIANLKVSDYRYSLSPTIYVTLYRAIQEALTNSAKYGQASLVKITIDFNKDSLNFKIKDNGKGCSSFKRGVGLSTMEERIHSLGGQIFFETNEGFSIDAIIPVEVQDE